MIENPKRDLVTLVASKPELPNLYHRQGEALRFFN